MVDHRQLQTYARDELVKRMEAVQKEEKQKVLTMADTQGNLCFKSRWMYLSNSLTHKSYYNLVLSDCPNYWVQYTLTLDFASIIQAFQDLRYIGELRQ